MLVKGQGGCGGVELWQRGIPGARHHSCPVHDAGTQRDCELSPKSAGAAQEVPFLSRNLARTPIPENKGTQIYFLLYMSNIKAINLHAWDASRLKHTWHRKKAFYSSALTMKQTFPNCLMKEGYCYLVSL